MKEKNANKKKKILFVAIATVMLLTMVGLCSWSIPVLLEENENVNIEEVPELNLEIIENENEINAEDNEQSQGDAMEFIKISNNDTNGKHYEFNLDEDDIGKVKIGTQISTKDYIYTFGYYWTENDAQKVAQEGSLDGWTLQGADVGWGVAVKNRTQQSYEDVYDSILTEPVTWLNGTFYNCVNLKQAPIISSNTLHTDYTFYNCQNLQSAIITNGISSLGNQMFYKCTSLKYIYMPKTVENVEKNDTDTFKSCSSDLKIYCEHEDDYFSNKSLLNNFEVFYKIPYDEMIRVKYDKFNGA